MSDRRTDFDVMPNVHDGKTDPAEYLAGLIYLDVQIGDDCVSGWVRPEVARTIKAAFGKPGVATPAPSDQRALFAAMALQSIIRQHPLLPISKAPNRFAEEAAQQATYYADALLAELSK